MTLIAADLYLLPITPDTESRRGALRVMDAARRLGKLNREPKLLGLVLNRVMRRSELAP